MLKAIGILLLAMLANTVVAGTDVYGVVAQMWVDASGNLWFRLNNVNADSICGTTKWYNNNLYVPASSPSYAAYYGIVLASITKNLTVDVPDLGYPTTNVNPCDITQTTYGIMLIPAHL
jgi:hypothetical protein